VTIPSYLVCAPKRKHDRGGIDRLLVGARFLAAAAVPPGISEKSKLTVVETNFLEKL
jgi:hypothetical protein